MTAAAESLAHGKVTLHCGDCLTVLATLPNNSVDSCVTDPPYHLTSIVQRFGTASENDDTSTSQRVRDRADGYARLTAGGFMGCKWDGGDIAFRPDVWREIARVLKPGGHLIAMGGTRTYHRLACAIEDAGFEIRDCVAWLYGSGFPKSHDVSKGIDRIGGHPWGIKFASTLDGAIKSAGYNYTTLDEALGIPSAGSNSCYWVRTDERGGLPPRTHYEALKLLLSLPAEFTDLYDKAEREIIAIQRRKNAPSGIVSAGRESVDVDREITIAATDAARQWQGWGTALKPAMELCVLARKPLGEATVAANVLKWGTGALNIDACRIHTKGEDMGDPSRFNGQDKKSHEGWLSPHKFDDELMAKKHAATFERANAKGRWPPNLCHDGSDEVLAGFPQTVSGDGGPSIVTRPRNKGWANNSPGEGVAAIDNYGDSGSAARFFYCAKADDDSRLGSRHPTVKPVSLMQWLVRMITPPNGVCLDCFAGTGTVGEACIRESFRAVLIEREAAYCEDIRRRMKLAMAGPGERARETIKAKFKGKPLDPGPLFEGLA